MEKWSSGVMECWGDATGGNRGNGVKKTSGSGLAPGRVPCIAIFLLPIPILSPKGIQQTSSSAPNRSPQRRPSRITRLVEGNWAAIISFLPRLQQVQSVLILTIMALAPSYHEDVETSASPGARASVLECGG